MHDSGNLTLPIVCAAGTFEERPEISKVYADMDMYTLGNDIVRTSDRKIEFTTMVEVPDYCRMYKITPTYIPFQADFVVTHILTERRLYFPESELHVRGVPKTQVHPSLNMKEYNTYLAYLRAAGTPRSFNRKRRYTIPLPINKPEDIELDGLF